METKGINMNKFRKDFIKFGKEYLKKGGLENYLKAQQALLEIEMAVYREINKKKK